MATVPSNLVHLKRLLIKHCDFGPDLFKDDYQIGGGHAVNWAGFAHQPCDARSACTAAFALDGRDPLKEVLDRRLLGAPVLFTVGQEHYEVWRPGRDSAEKVDERIPVGEIRAFIQRHKAELNRDRLYQAKTRGRIPESDRQLPLFVDPGVLVYAESKLGQQLTKAVVDAVRVLAKGRSGVPDWTFSATFRLLAAKILKDKRVPGFASAELSDVERSVCRVEKHYGSREPLAIDSEAKRERLVDVAKRFNQLGDLRNLTTESLADVYEQALITAETRKVHGTHKTPAYLVDYVVWQLADWIAEIPVDRLRLFEPACGHAPFLVAAMRLLRTLDLGLPAGTMSEFLRERLLGIETDPFALEIARLSLTVADEPNPDGWDGLKSGDMFAGDYLETIARESTVLLTNPPFEERKAERLLERTLPHLPIGAVFGIVVPATILFSEKKRPKQLREWLIRHCQIGEVSLFPDGIFDFADQECTVLLGRRLPEGLPVRSLRTRLRRVREPDRKGFQQDYRFTTSRVGLQSQFCEEPESELWIAEFSDEIWSWLGHLPTLDSIAILGKGLEYKSAGKVKNAIAIQDHRFPKSVEGFDTAVGDWCIHEHAPIRHFNLDPDVIRRPGTGTACIPQVLINYAPVGRGVWRLKPFIDAEGRAFTSRLVSVRPRDESCTLEFLWAVCNSPLAHFYVYTHALKREIGVLGPRRLPVVSATPHNIRVVSNLASRYLDIARRGPQDMFSKQGYTGPDLVDCLRALDAEVLRLYGLSADAERFLLDQFADEQRPGVPVDFTRYYPADFDAPVPLYAYLSHSFQQALRGESPDLTDEEERRYDELLAKEETGTLAEAEADELHRLQAEIDGRDYATLVANKWCPHRSNDGHDNEMKLKALGDRLVSEALKEGWGA
jgi:hypothetical protein